MILQGDWIEVLKALPAESVHCVITSPPYWGLRDYGTAQWQGGQLDCDHVSGMARGDTERKTPGGRGGSFRGGVVQFSQSCGKCGATRIDQQLGLEKTPQEYIAKMVAGFREVRRVLRKDGTAWVNMGDCWNSRPGSHRGKHADGGIPRVMVYPERSSCNFKPKDLVGLPWMLAFALRADGWYLRQDIIWAKPNPLPESVTDRCTKSHEYMFLLTKGPRYFFDAEAIKEPIIAKTLTVKTTPRKGRGHESTGEKLNLWIEQHGGRYYPATRNKRSVWTIAPKPFKEAHFATFPPKLVEPCLLAGTSQQGCCPRCGAPYGRVTERRPTGAVQKMTDGWDTGPGGHGTVHREGREPGATGKAVMVNHTVGWRASCKCEAGEPVACTVLDPFAGAGTVGLVAQQHGRRFIGIELNAQYIEIADRRLAT